MEHILESKHLGTLIEEYVFYKRSLGYAYNTEAYYLKEFTTFCSLAGCEGLPSADIVRRWIRKRTSETPATQRTRVSPVRAFFKHLSTLGYGDVYQVPRKVCPAQQRSLPHFLTDEETRAFFVECDRIPYIKEQRARHLIIPAIFRLIYCCGLRPKEARTLLVQNVHLHDGYIDILQSKGFKDRRLFLTDELIGMLTVYDAEVFTTLPDRVYFFPKNEKSCYSDEFISANFNRIWERALPMSSAKATTYAFRHHFAFANINRWLEEGKDVNAMLPYLMRYMGHATILSTFYYIHFVPQFYGTYLDFVEATEDVLPEVGYED